MPFDNCTEPSNVKAGGGSYPIRFQCSGCAFYRPDPSFVPAAEDHIRALKADREMARALRTAKFVVRNFSDQIDSFQNVVTSIRRQLEAMPEDDRRHLEEASAVLRKVHAAAPLPVLPVPEGGPGGWGRMHAVPRHGGEGVELVINWGLVDSTAYLVKMLEDPPAYGVDLARTMVLHQLTGDEWPATRAHADIGKSSYWDLRNGTSPTRRGPRGRHRMPFGYPRGDGRWGFG